METGLLIRQLRKQKKWTQEELADKMGVTKQSISKYEDGKVPLLPEAMVILEKYDFVLPVSSNATMNSYLKEVADICGLTCELTTHVARKTFGMYMLNELKYPLEVVSRMLGHNSVRTTQTWYVKIEEGNIERYAYR